ncbi:MAG TPA: tannase/feruloyl esterase family alpha/beta hydrolase [Bacteroidetes bacterium]|nr:tannase/feruloyl esterase family alpha/beta hydrolase [Bacteroidota bacterium]
MIQRPRRMSNLPTTPARPKRRRSAAPLCVVLAPLLTVACSLTAHAQPGPACERLVGVALSEASVVNATPVAAGALEPALDDTVDVAVPFCRVSVVARPTPASEIGIEVWLPEPSAWTGRLWGWGNSGYGGSIAYPRLAEALGAGYATVATDGGHRGRGTAWALRQPEKVADLGHRAVYLAAVAAKALAAAHYGEAPRFAYFSGYSTGGTQGLRLAQRYPDAYDGILAGGADQDWTGLYLWLGHLQFEQLTDPTRHLSPAQVAALAAAALAVCGDASGTVSSPDRCSVDAVLGAYASSAETPLTAPQTDYVRMLYAGPADPAGEPLVIGYAPGSEAGWDGVHFGGTAGRGSWVAGYLTSFFRNVAYGDTTWTPAAFRFDRDSARTDAALADAMNATDPDLRRFAARGGRLILWHGWSDPLVPAGFTLQYHERVREALGPLAASDAVRLFMVPGVGHQSGDSHRRLGAALQAWVETGVAPERATSVVGDGPGGPGSFAPTRLLCAWPRAARYRGSGPPKDAASYDCVLPD